MRLIDLIQQEFDVDAQNVMFLRHGNERVAVLRGFGDLIEEYTAVQDVRGDYDLWHPDKPKVRVLVVVVDDRVRGVYRVHGILKTGLRNDICSLEYRNFGEE